MSDTRQRIEQRDALEQRARALRAEASDCEHQAHQINMDLLYSTPDYEEVSTQMFREKYGPPSRPPVS